MFTKTGFMNCVEHMQILLQTYQVLVYGERYVFEHDEDVSDRQPLKQTVDWRRCHIPSRQYSHVHCVRQHTYCAHLNHNKINEPYFDTGLIKYHTYYLICQRTDFIDSELQESRYFKCFYLVIELLDEIHIFY